MKVINRLKKHFLEVFVFAFVSVFVSILLSFCSFFADSYKQSKASLIVTYVPNTAGLPDFGYVDFDVERAFLYQCYN
jgi:hypothetical protein